MTLLQEYITQTCLREDILQFPVFCLTATLGTRMGLAGRGRVIITELFAKSYICRVGNLELFQGIERKRVIIFLQHLILKILKIHFPILNCTLLRHSLVIPLPFLTFLNIFSLQETIIVSVWVRGRIHTITSKHHITCIFTLESFPYSLNTNGNRVIRS